MKKRFRCFFGGDGPGPLTEIKKFYKIQQIFQNLRNFTEFNHFYMIQKSL